MEVSVCRKLAEVVDRLSQRGSREISSVLAAGPESMVRGTVTMKYYMDA